MGFTWFPQVFCGFLGFLCDLGHKMGDFTGDYWRFGVCGGSGLGKTNLAKAPRITGTSSVSENMKWPCSFIHGSIWVTSLL